MSAAIFTQLIYNSVYVNAAINAVDTHVLFVYREHTCLNCPFPGLCTPAIACAISLL